MCGDDCAPEEVAGEVVLAGEGLPGPPQIALSFRHCIFPLSHGAGSLKPESRKQFIIFNSILNWLRELCAFLRFGLVAGESRIFYLAAEATAAGFST